MTIENPSVHPLNTTNEGNPGAFAPEPGMTLRDHFAGQAMAALISAATASYGSDHPAANKTLAVVSYMLADAMLAERVVVRS